MTNIIFKISTVLLLVFTIPNSYSQDESLYKQITKFGRFIDCLNRFYYDSVEIDKVVEDAIVHQLKELDPHSTYISAEDVKKMNEPLEGNFEGIGISFNILNDTLFVITPIPGGPSEKVGIRAGDRIIKVDGENIAGTGLTNEDVFSLLKGPKGTKVTVSILRRKVDELIDFLIVRDKIPIHSLDASYIIKPVIGYIKLNRFSKTTIDEFKEAAKELKEQGANDLILDLTGNSGGYLETAIDLADQFLTKDKMVVYTKGLNSPRSDHKTTSTGIFNEGKVVIMIDEGSASASEIVSGAVQDWDRGIIVGRRSFGKGLVQRPFMLTDESVIRLTVARYYTPSGRLIQKPFDEGIENYRKEIYERYEKGEFVTKDSIDFPDSLKYKTLVYGRTVYGGGGIMPDIFVPLDTTSYSEYYSTILRKGILNQFVLEYVDDERTKLNKEYPDFETFKEKFEVTEPLIKDLVKYAEKEEVEKNQEELERSKDQLYVTIKALMARDLWSSGEFYEVLNQSNDTYLQAVETMEQWSGYWDELKKD